MRILSLIILIVVVGVVIWWFTSDNASAPVIDGTIHYNQDASAFSELFFKLDCSLVRRGEYSGENMTCQLNQ